MIKLNNDQETSIDVMSGFITDKYNKDNMFLLEGQAGTGKTTCINHLVKRFPRIKFIFTAPTNKATKVLNDMTYSEEVNVSCITIYSLLGLAVSYKEDSLVLKEVNRPSINNYDVVVVDEGSMVNREIYDRCKRHKHVKFIFMGDPYQLPPIGEEESITMRIRQKCVLSKVERHDNQILALATRIRESIENGGTAVSVKTDRDANGGIFVCKRESFKPTITKMLNCEGYKEDPSKYKVVAWRNTTVVEYNNFIREQLYGDISHDIMFFKGERVIATHPVIYSEVMLLMTDEEAVVEKVKIKQHEIYPELKCYELALKKESSNIVQEGSLVYVDVVHQDSLKAYKDMLSVFAFEARNSGRKWKDFWDLKQAHFNDIRSCHAITAHRSQGSTYNSVMVDVGDILMNYDEIEALKCFYVATTRASRSVILTL